MNAAYDSVSIIQYTNPAVINDIMKKCCELVKDRYESQVINDKFRLCFYEILTNAIEHGNKQNSDKELKVELHFYKDKLMFKVEDMGEGFNWRKTEYSFTGDEGYRGRGLKIVKYYSSSLTFNDKGNIVTVVLKV